METPVLQILLCPCNVRNGTAARAKVAGNSKNVLLPHQQHAPQAGGKSQLHRAVQCSKAAPCSKRS